MAGVVHQVRQTEAHLGIRCLVGRGNRVAGLFKYQPEDFQVYEVPIGQRALSMKDVFEYDPRTGQSPADMKGYPFIQFNLFKRNMETNVAVDRMARATGIPKNAFGTAGMKDKRAESLQQVTIPSQYLSKLQNSPFDTSPIDLAAVESATAFGGIHNVHGANFKSCSTFVDAAKQQDSANRVPADLYRDIRVAGFRGVGAPLAIGETDGNEFHIALRDAQPGCDDALRVLKDHGFVNYFGPQRFGLFGTVPALGRAYLTKDYNEFINLSLDPAPLHPKSAAHAACMEWNEHRDAKKALQVFNSSSLRYFKNGLDSTAAQMVHRTLCALDEHGSPSRAVFSLPAQHRRFAMHSYASLVWNRLASWRIENGGSDVQDFDWLGSEFQAMPVTNLPIEERRQKTISDVVLPVFGSRNPGDPEYNGPVFDALKHILAQDGFRSDFLDHEAREFSLKTVWRRMILRPGNVQWQWKRYTEPMKSFFSGLKHQEPAPENLNAMHCLCVSFSLPPGVFASMAVRELTGNAVSDDDGRHHAQEYMRKINSHSVAFQSGPRR